MARKNIIKILSGCCIFVFAVILSNPGAYASVSDIGIEIQTFQVSGSIDSVEGVVLKGFPGDPYVETNSNGEYYFDVEFGESFVIVPEKDGYTFSPSSIRINEIEDNMVNQDFKATQITYTVSGKIGNMEGVVLNGLPGNPTTNANGMFSVLVPYGWEGYVEPLKDGFEFEPPLVDISALKSNKTISFSPSEIKIEISGNVGAGGVLLDGLPGRVISEDDGSYSVTVGYNYSGKVTPIKEGYSFDPPDYSFSGLTDDMYQAFTANAKQFIISGKIEIDNIGLAGVLLEGFETEVYTNADGSYTTSVDYDFTGTIKPVLPGNSFKPGSMIYTKVKEDKLNQDYKASVRTYTIKGKTGTGGVKLVGLPGDPVSGPDGSYQVNVEYDWSGYVMPEKEGYSFEPSDRDYSGVAEDYMNDNYVASPKEYTISGNAGIGGVILRGFPGKPVETDSTGYYSTTVSYGWTGIVTPQKQGYDFEPKNIQFPKITEDRYGEDFISEVQKFTISGTMTSTSDNKPVEGIEISFGSEGSTTTDSQGKYSFEVPYGWTGGVLPDLRLEGYTFQPKSFLYENNPVRRDERNKNFKATIQTFTIHDVLEFRDKALQNVKITANPGNIVTHSNSKGEFTIEVPYGWTGAYTLEKKGITFKPDTIEFENVTTDYEYGQAIYDESVPNVSNDPDPTDNVMEPIDNTNTGNEIPEEIDETPNTDNQQNPPTGGSTFEDSEAYRIMRAEIDRLTGIVEENNTTTKPPRVAPDATGSILVSETFIGDDLLMALDQLAADSGVAILYGATVQGMVTCEFQDIPLEEALNMILAPHPYYAKKMGDNPPYYVVSEARPENQDGMFPRMSETEVVPLEFVPARVVLESLSPTYTPFVNAVDDPNAYSVTVTAPRSDLERIKSDIKAIDVKPTQVLLEARIVVLEEGDLLNLGVQWDWPSVSVGGFSNNHRGIDALDLGGKTAWGIQMGYTPDATFTNALEAVLNALEVDQKAKILSKPAVMAIDHHQANIKVLREDYYVLYATGLSDNVYSRQEIEKITTGTVLAITPHINSNDDIVLKVAVEVSDTVSNSVQSDLPSVSRRTAQSTLRIYDGGTVAIAGLTENRQMDTKRGVPIVSQIPIVGELFKNNYKNNSNKEVAIFITANIIHENEQQNQLAAQPRVGFLGNNQPAPAPTQLPISSDLYRTNSTLDTNRNSADVYNQVESMDRTRRSSTSSLSFDNDNYGYQNDQLLGYDNTNNSRNDTRRTATRTRTLSPEEQFRMGVDDSLMSSQGGRYGGSQY